MSKEEFIKELSNAGYDAEFNSHGIPTVFVEAPTLMNAAKKAIRTVSKKFGYDQSYSICLSKMKSKTKNNGESNDVQKDY